MSNAFVRVPPDSTGKRIDNISLDDEGVAVYRQIVAIGGSATGTVALITNASAGATDFGLVVRPTTATVVVAGGGIAISGTAQVALGTAINVNPVAISGTVTVAGNFSFGLSADASIGINSIGTVTVTGGVAISGTAQVAIGTAINVNPVAISGTAQVALGTAINVNPVGISGTVQVAIGTPFTVNNISAAVTVTGGVAISGTAQVAIGTPFTLQGISTTVQVAIGTPFTLNNISRSVVSVISGFYPNSAGATNTIQVADSANSALRVNVVAGAAGGVSHVDNASFTAGAASFVPIGGIFDDASPGAVSENAAAVARITSARAIHVNLRDSAGNELSIGTATVAGNVGVIGVYANSAGATNLVQVGDSANTAIRVNIVAGGTGGGLVSVTGTVIVAISTPYVLQGISTTVTVAGTIALSSNASVGINSIGTVTVTGGVAVSGTAVSVISGFYPNSAGATNTIQVADSANSALRVNVVAGAAGGVSHVDNASFTAGAASFVPIGGIFDDASPGATSENAAAVARITSARAIHVNLRDAAGNEFTTGTAVVAGNVGIMGVYANSAGATNIVQVGDSANTAIRVNVVAGGTGGGLVSVTGTVIVAISTPYILQGISTTVQVAGVVSLGAGTNLIGAVSLAAGTANIGTLNNISAAVTVTGGVAISGTAQVAIGTPIVINNISATTVVSGLVSVTGTVIVAISTPYILQGISTTVQVAVGTPFVLQGISTTVTVAGTIALSSNASVGINSIGSVNVNGGVAISGTATVTGAVRLNPAPAVMSATRGPKCVTASTSANVTLIASPGAGANIYVTKIFGSNASGTGFAMRVGTSASIQTVVGFAASSGGGFVVDFGDMPWMLSASEAAVCSVKPNGSYGLFNVHFYVV